MLKEIDTAKANELLKSMVIPPRPTVLLQLEQEQTKAEPDFNQIAQIISSDLTLSAAVLKTVNSPFFSLANRVSSVSQALQLLGLRNLGNIVRGVLLRRSLSPDGEQKMERFWLKSARVALVSAKLAETFGGELSRDEAYSYGLFQDCGMPLMQARYKHYQATLDKCESLPLHKMLEIEEQRHKANHVDIGFLLARTWYLPTTINQAILNHHDIEIFFKPQDGDWHYICSLIAMAGLAEHIVKRHYVQEETSDWRQLEPILLRHLSIDRTEYEDFSDRVNRLLEST